MSSELFLDLPNRFNSPASAAKDAGGNIHDLFLNAVFDSDEMVNKTHRSLLRSL